MARRVKKASPRADTRTSASKPAGKASGGKVRKTKTAASKRQPARKATKATPAGRARGRGKAGRPVEVEQVIMRVRELDPRAKIGPGTGVQRLFRVDAVSSRAAETHLVFLDKHGLYCEHGRGCPAVSEVTKLDKSLRRTNQVG